MAFVLGGRRWVLPTEEVDSVAEPPTITPLPTADPRRLGVFVHRGLVVAAVSATGAGEGRRSGHCVVLREEGFALLVDELIGLEVTSETGVPEGFEVFDRRALAQVLADPALPDESVQVALETSRGRSGV